MLASVTQNLCLDVHLETYTITMYYLIKMKNKSNEEMQTNGYYG